MVELDAQRAAQFADRDGGVEAAVPDAELVQQAQRLPGEVAELRMVPLGLQFRDHDDGEHDFVLVEAGHGVRVGQQDAGVEDIGAPVGMRRFVLVTTEGRTPSDEVGERRRRGG